MSGDNAPDEESIKSLFGQARDLPPGERERFLDKLPKDVRAEVEALLRHELPESKFLAPGEGLHLAASSVHESMIGHALPESIGPYRIVKRLGEGGFGDVFLAEQRDPRRSVALKIIKQGMGSKEVFARFEVERHALALMKHENVARVFEAGVTSDGSPFFAMEYVDDGVALTEYCDSESLSLDDRLQLLSQVCAGVHHAHQKGVIHRDLKPSNILVTVQDGIAIPKIIDFGVARPMDEALVEETLRTEPGELVGTLGYMSPEQVEGDRGGIDIRTDVYALGVVLYELVTGCLPFDRLRLRRSSLPEILRVVREHVPPRPSTRLEMRSSVEPQGRAAALIHLMRAVRGDLDSITMKAMEKDRERRYASASELAADIQRFLRHEPVLARPPSRVYSLKKFAWRFRVQVAASIAVLVSLVAGTVTSGYFWLRAETRLADFQRMADVRRMQDLEREAREDLWPASEGKAPDMEAWMQRAEGVLARLTIHQRKLKKLRVKARPYTQAMRERDRERHPRAKELRKLVRQHNELITDLAEFRKPAKRSKAAQRKVRAIEARLPSFVERMQSLLDEAERDRSWVFDDAEDQWQHDVIAGLVRRLQALGDAESGMLTEVRERLQWARKVRWLTVENAGARNAWNDAIDSIRAADGVQASKLYEGLGLRQQVGLVPIGMNPATRLWEFYHLRSAAPDTPCPKHDDQGRIHVTADTGIVLVLIPAGSFLMGAQRGSSPNEDPSARLMESPVSRVELSAFFFSRYELTQGQWIRLSRDNPSVVKPASGNSITLAHPVENVTWNACQTLLQKQGLTLPTEAQWEYACRGGTGTPWWTGTHRKSLIGAANLADRTAADKGARWPQIRDWPELEDGFALHAPVDSLRPNPFGLHHVYGNVNEWCLDWYGSYEEHPRLRDGSRTGKGEFRIYRGGSFRASADQARSAYRQLDRPESRSHVVGVRPAMEIGDSL